MTKHVARLYALALALLVFFVLWVGIAARPWTATPVDPRAQALVLREQHLRHDALVVKQLLNRRWAVYRVQLAQRNTAIVTARSHQRQLAAGAAAARASTAAQSTSAGSSGVRIVNLPPLTITRTS